MIIKEDQYEKVLYFLITVSLIFSLAYLLYYTEYKNTYKTYDISEININLIGEKIETCGIIKYMKTTPKVNLIKLTNQIKEILVADFKFKYTKYKKGDFICVKGVIKQYKGNLEIVSN